MFNLRQQKKNTWKDVTPFPDQDTIRHDIAQANFRSKLDMTEAYEQMHIRPEDVVCYNIQHLSEMSNVDGRLQCALHISVVDDRYIPRLSWKVHTCISR